jgi:hypothetical protein
MEIITAAEGLYQQLLQRRNEILEMPVPLIERYQKIVAATNELLVPLALMVKDTSLPDMTTEVMFFKNVLPPFYTIGLYYTTLFHLEATKPIGSVVALKQWHEWELNRISALNNQHYEFNRYYRSHQEHLDQLYFTRKGGMHLLASEPMSLFFGQDICTVGTYKVAFLKTHELILEFLNASLYKIDHPDQAFTELPPLQWTDSKNGLIELIYALQEKGCFNNGGASVKQITNFFEKVFKVELGNTSRTFQVIMSRKLDYANFLEKLKQRFLQRIDRNEQRHIK